MIANGLTAVGPELKLTLSNVREEDIAVSNHLCIATLTAGKMDLNLKVLEPSGIFDGTQAPEFRHQLDEAVAAGANRILIDFQKVSFMDSSGLAALVIALKTTRGAGCHLFLCSINDQIKMLLEMTSMTQVFRIFNNRTEFEQLHGNFLDH